MDEREPRGGEEEAADVLIVSSRACFVYLTLSSFLRAWFPLIRTFKIPPYYHDLLPIRAFASSLFLYILLEIIGLSSYRVLYPNYKALSNL